MSKPKSPRISREQRMDWRNLPIEHWNVLTFTTYFAEMNEEYFGVPRGDYLPMRNWRTEQGMLKRAIDEHGSTLLRAAFDECFRTHRVNRKYPILTAGFACSYLINGVIAAAQSRIRAEEQRKEADEEREGMDLAEVSAWL